MRDNGTLRSRLRTAAVLPVEVLRDNGSKQLAHTLDLTAASARLGGLFLPVEPGEIVEIKRSGAKARFKVVWLGKAGGPSSGQAGLRAMEPRKSIWRVTLPADARDTRCNLRQLRSDLPWYRTDAEGAERRWALRLDCRGGTTVQSIGSKFPIYAQISDISRGGVYVQTTAVFAVKSVVTLQMNIGGFLIEMEGRVRTSDPLVGMGISFEHASPANYQKLALALEELQRQMTASSEQELAQSGAR